MLTAWKAALRAEEAYDDARARGRPRDLAATTAFIALTADADGRVKSDQGPGLNTFERHDT